MSTHGLISEELKLRLEKEGLEVADLIAVPSGADRMVRFRTLQEVLSEFETTEPNDSQTYVLHIRKQKQPVQPLATPAHSDLQSAAADGIYLANGKLNTEYLLGNAKTLFFAGDFAAARQIYSAITQSDDRSPESLLGIARCLEAEERTDAALKAYDDSILYHPSIEAYRRYASLLIRNQKDQQAAEVLERALLLKDLSEKSRYDLHQAAGNACFRAELSAKAERHYRKALEYHPHSDGVATNLGTLCLQQSRVEEAKQAFQESLRVNSANEKAWFGLGTAELAMGDKTSALHAFAKSLEIKIQQPQAIFHLVKCAYETKEFARAVTLLRAYVDVSPFNPHLLYSLAGLEYHLGDRAAALRTARTILRIQPTHEEAKTLVSLIENSV
ncbi:MAG: tetratricopeptide repeat protein [Cryobacterium sp.]|nr:tetratricopeptide repeat protein [Oligoflexia bacterium]